MEHIRRDCPHPRREPQQQHRGQQQRQERRGSGGNYGNSRYNRPPSNRGPQHRAHYTDDNVTGERQYEDDFSSYFAMAGGVREPAAPSAQSVAVQPKLTYAQVTAGMKNPINLVSENIVPIMTPKSHDEISFGEYFAKAMHAVPAEQEEQDSLFFSVEDLDMIPDVEASSEIPTGQAPATAEQVSYIGGNELTQDNRGLFILDSSSSHHSSGDDTLFYDLSKPQFQFVPPVITITSMPPTREQWSWKS